MFEVTHAISPYDAYCDGYGNPGASGGSYFVGLNIGIGKVQKALFHKGSQLLDEINAFDRAEVDKAYLGQINMITVSSFCGPKGAIWGYHAARPTSLYQKNPYFLGETIMDGKKSIPVFDAAPLFEATRMLFGTVAKKQFPLMPGAHVPCAMKKVILHGPAHIYSCLGVGIAEDRITIANLLMEDVGSMHHKVENQKEENEYRNMILHNKAKSIVEIAHNQKIHFKEIFLGMIDSNIQEGEVGCALVAAPYFTLAKKAFVNNLANTTLEQWKEQTRN